MKTCRTIESLRRERTSDSDARVGFVPTMGFLHEGHLSLVRASCSENDRTVVSIFVNPTQFGPGEDLQRYPRDIPRDTALLEKEGVNLLFVPDSAEMYPEGHATVVSVEGLDQPLCGRSRPGHFRGVATVVLKLFSIVQPDRAYFGQKDAQQAIIIRQLILDLHLAIGLRVMPIVRDADGLALSSRNVHLSPEERQAALALPRALAAAQEEVRAGTCDSAAIRRLITGRLEAEKRIRVDYVEIVSLDRLSPLPAILPRNTLVACAIRVGHTRLIDNFILGEIAC